MKDFLQFALIGIGAGSAYALFAQGAVLIYRGSGVVNFGHGALGTLGAYVTFRELRADGDVPIAVAIAAGVAVTVAVTVVFQVAVLRVLARAAPITRIIATIGLLTVMQAAVAQRYGEGNHLVPPFLPHDTFDWAGIQVQEQVLYIVGISSVVTVALWWLTKHLRVGLAITATAQDERAVQTLGWSPSKLALLVWGVGGGLAALAGILVAPLTGLSPIGFTVVVTVAGLAAALVGGFRSFPLTFVGGLVVGVGESLVTLYGNDIERFFQQDRITGLNRAVPFALILLVLVVRGRSLPVRGHITDRLPRLGTGQINVPVLLAGVTLALVLILGVFDEDWAAAAFRSLAAGTIGLSVVVLTGYAGQLSLGQWALAGSGALIAGSLVYRWDIPQELAIPLGMLLTVPVGLLFALPALRTRGVNLAVVTLGLGFTVSEVVFNNARWVGEPTDGGTRIGRPRLFGIDVDAATNPHRLALVSLVAFVVAGLVVANLRRSRTGLRLIAVRTNERAAASLGISVFGAKLYAFGVASALAGLGGILLGFQSDVVTYTRFGVLESVFAVGNAVIGGLGYVIGAVVAAVNAGSGLGTLLLQEVFEAGDWDHLVGGVLLLILVVTHQDGIADVALHAAGALRRKLRPTTRRRPPPELTAAPAPAVLPLELRVSSLTVRLGAVLAVDGVSFDLEPGKIVGLIGPNGAGKTTIIDAVTGFVPAARGTISLGDTRIDRLSASRRARLGVRRSFQSLELFDDLSVADNLRAGSADVGGRWRGLADLVWPARQPLDPSAAGAVRQVGLTDVLEDVPEALPYGRRRLVGIARAVASGPSVVLLDEPAAGLDERETAELGALIARLAREQGMAVLLVEHDVGLVMSICDQIVVLEAGRMIVRGTPDEIRSDPAVRRAYLGAIDEQVPAATASPSLGVTAERPSVSAAPRAAAVPLVECRGLSSGYGEMAVLRDVDLHVDAGEVVVLLGANGAGKTTTLLTLAGDLAPLGGEVRWMGEKTSLPMHVRCNAGLSFLTEERSVFVDLTVADNLKLAGVPADHAVALFPELEPLLRRRAGLLSGGEQQMLALARALGRRPRLLLADELSLGLAPLVVDRLLRALRTAATDDGVGVLLVEQHVQQALAIADRAYVLSRGVVIATGSAEDVSNDMQRIESAYLS